jgi:hypothetical protein
VTKCRRRHVVTRQASSFSASQLVNINSIDFNVSRSPLLGGKGLARAVL